uniref:Brain-specific angiogenesis inhibitor 1-associated protein 2-like n=1 Tax=Petromyzon marinus TaxID=7757 RepID=A0AAJ7TUA2_PETMA|nr:brain-specific angiogenesis inhibitor 1-associated protein 2-like [Petromyzon marinus]XP_032822829.1 brain-specific angiogenesis inhibitor 1-associated protein 2-like [Petromyzon marinus]
MSPIEEAAKLTENAYKTIMEQYNPCLRNFVAMGKCYEKALSGVTHAAKGYFDALVKLGEIASESQASRELGDTVFQMAEVHRQIQIQMEEAIKSLHMELLSQLEQKLDQDVKYVSLTLKRFQVEHRAHSDGVEKVRAELKRVSKKSSKNPGKYRERESKVLSHMQMRHGELQQFVSDGYRNALVEERRRYCFLVDRQCAVTQVFAQYHGKSKELMTHKMASWQTCCLSASTLPPRVSVLMQKLEGPPADGPGETDDPRAASSSATSPGGWRWGGPPAGATAPVHLGPRAHRGGAARAARVGALRHWRAEARAAARDAPRAPGGAQRRHPGGRDGARQGGLHRGGLPRGGLEQRLRRLRRGGGGGPGQGPRRDRGPAGTSEGDDQSGGAPAAGARPAVPHAARQAHAHRQHRQRRRRRRRRRRQNRRERAKCLSSVAHPVPNLRRSFPRSSLLRAIPSDRLLRAVCGGSVDRAGSAVAAGGPQLARSSSASAGLDSVGDGGGGGGGGAVGMQVEALFQHVAGAQEGTLLSFDVGDVITMLAPQPQDGWQYGENVHTGRRGWFPVTYTRPLDADDDAHSSHGEPDTLSSAGSYHEGGELPLPSTDYFAASPYDPESKEEDSSDSALRENPFYSIHLKATVTNDRSAPHM